MRWRLDETYIKVNGKWCYLYRAVDKEGKTIDFLLTHRRKKRTAHRFLTKAITQNGIASLAMNVIPEAGVNVLDVMDELKAVTIPELE